jgi:hypothetical protein
MELSHDVNYFRSFHDLHSEAPVRTALTHSYVNCEQEAHKLPLGNWKFCARCLITIIELFQSTKYCCHGFWNYHCSTQATPTNQVWTPRYCPCLCGSCDYPLSTNQSSLCLRVTTHFRLYQQSYAMVQFQLLARWSNIFGSASSRIRNPVSSSPLFTMIHCGGHHIGNTAFILPSFGCVRHPLEDELVYHRSMPESSPFTCK